MGMYLSAKFYTKKKSENTVRKYLKMLKLLLSFVFLVLESKFLMVYPESIDMVRLNLASKMLKKQHFKVWKLLLNNWLYYTKCYI